MKNRSKRFTQKHGIILFVFIVSALFVYIYVLPDVSDAFRRTDIIEYGSIRIQDEAVCYLIRGESVYRAGITGPVQYYVHEGDQVRNGTRIMDIGQGAEVFTADKRGMVSFFVDGQESIFKPDTMKDLTREATAEITEDVADLNGKEAAAGVPVYKIVDSEIWYTVMWIDKKSIIKYEKGSDITLLHEESTISGTVEDIVNSGDSFLVILKFDKFWEQMPRLRRIDAEIITADYKGLMLRNESITKVDEKNGVYVKDMSGSYIFKPVRIITSDGKYSLVECGYYYENSDEGSKRVETVDIYDEVLRNGKPD